MTDLPSLRRPRLLAAAAGFTLCLAAAAVLAQGRPTLTERAANRAADRSATRNGDYIVAIVNQELVTAVEVSLRERRARDEAERAKVRLPAEEELQRQIVDALVEERAILTFARENGVRVDEVELDRALQAVAAQSQLTVEQLRERLKTEGLDFVRFRNNLRDQLVVERTREREVYQRIRTTDADIDRYLEQQRSAAMADAPLNLAQILVTVPEDASPAEVSARRSVADKALARVVAGEPFEAVAREVSQDGNRDRGGEIGLRPASRLPDLFVEATRDLRAGAVVPRLVRSPAGFHILKVLVREDAGMSQVTQTRVRHILLRPAARRSLEQIRTTMAEYRRRIDSGSATFEDLARQYSEDGSATAGGDLGWATPGMMVPEFEEAMNALPVGGLSQPVNSRFGVHLVQVLERRQVDVDPKQVRDQARNSLREQKFDEAYAEWVRDVKSRAYIEMREPPL